MSLSVALDASIAGLVRLGTASIEGARVEAESAALRAEIEAFRAEFRARHGGQRSAEIPGAEAARALYKALGIDPTKTRPSSEALARRILKGEGLPPINTLVDALNLCSVKHQLPFGLYDRDRITPPVTLRLGRAGESYEGIRKAVVNVEGRPVLADAGGPFGNPTSDSGRTAVGPSTVNAWVVLYAPSSLPAAQVEAITVDAAQTMARSCGGRIAGLTHTG